MVDYPYWQMNPLIKRYYLMQLAYWVQQLFVLVLGLEKPRKDFKALVVHHLVTIWLVGGSYTLNFTPFGNASTWPLVALLVPGNMMLMLG